MHALLALSGSHEANAHGRHDLLPAVEFHRLRALTGVNSALDQENLSSDLQDALIGACYALTFQNSH